MSSQVYKVPFFNWELGQSFAVDIFILIAILYKCQNNEDQNIHCRDHDILINCSKTYFNVACNFILLFFLLNLVILC